MRTATETGFYTRNSCKSF